MQRVGAHNQNRQRHERQETKAPQTIRGYLLAQKGNRPRARIFRMLNEVAIEAIETGVEQITDEALERYKPVGKDEAAFQ